MNLILILILPHGSVRGLYGKKELKKRKLKNVGGSFTGKKERNKNEIKKRLCLSSREKKS